MFKKMFFVGRGFSLALAVLFFAHIAYTATETLRPNAAGDETSIAYQCPSGVLHWENVDEATADENITEIYTSSATYQRDLYNLPAHSVGSGIINFIKIYIRCLANTTYAYAKPSLKSDATVTDGTEIALTPNWTTYSQQWNTNPADGQAWGWSDIDTLQIGVSLKGTGSWYAECTQVYVEVDYTPITAPTVTTNTATLVEETSSTGNGTITVTGGEDPTRYIEWGPNTSYGDSCSAGAGGTGAYSCGMTGLSPGTLYHYRAKAYNSAGWGYGADSLFLTKPEAPSGFGATPGEQ